VVLSRLAIRTVHPDCPFTRQMHRAVDDLSVDCRVRGLIRAAPFRLLERCARLQQPFNHSKVLGVANVLWIGVAYATALDRWLAVRSNVTAVIELIGRLRLQLSGCISRRHYR